MKNKGFTLIETLTAAFILIIVGTGIAGIYIMEGALLKQAAHRITAAYYARSCANRLIDTVGPAQKDFRSAMRSANMVQRLKAVGLSTGLHTQGTDPLLCSLPVSDFKDFYGGTLQYTIDAIPLPDNATAGAFRANILVEWEEKFPNQHKTKESMSIILFSYLGNAPAF